MQASITPTKSLVSSTLERLSLPKTKHMQRTLLIIATACAILSLIPPLRLAGALALRGTAILASGVNVIDSWKMETTLGRLCQIAKVAVVVLGVVALAVASPVLIVASIAADLGLQIVEFGRALYHRDVTKALCHFAFILIDTFALAGLIAGSWELMVTALAVQGTAMLCLGIAALAWGITNHDKGSLIDSLCFALLTAVGYAGAITTSKIEDMAVKKARFDVKNNTDGKMEIENYYGETVETIEPGKSAQFEIGKYEGFGMYGKTVKVFYYNPQGQFDHIDYIVSTDFDRDITKYALPAKYFPTLPVGGNTFIQNFRKLFLSKDKQNHPVQMQ